MTIPSKIIIFENKLFNDEDRRNNSIRTTFGQTHVYNGHKMEVKKGEEICSAASVIDGFEISVDKVLGIVE